MTITRTPIIDDDGTGRTGTIINNAWKQQFYDQIDAALPVSVPWTQVPYSAGLFTGMAPMTWTVEAGDVANYAYTVLGKTMYVTFALQTTTVGGTLGSILQIQLPGIYTAMFRSDGSLYYQDNGVSGVGIVQVLQGGNVLRLIKAGVLNWAAATNNTFVSGTLILPVN